MSFTRRVGYQPGLDFIQQIEGVVIIDLPTPGSISGTDTGVAAVVGEFADMGYAVSVDTSGNVTTKAQPTEAFGPTDLVQKFGGFDETLGEFGGSGGNGFEAIRNKRFSRLICVPVNLCSTKGARFFRELPLCRSATDANPVLPVSGGTIAAGREFRNGSGRMRIGTAVNFTAKAPIATGVGGSLASASTAVTQTFTGAGGLDWTLINRPDGTLGAHKGDILVIGNNSAGSRVPSAEAGTYRVASDPSSGAAITIEKLDGSTFAITTQTTIPWRLHFCGDADSAPERVPGSAAPGGYAAGEAGGFIVPVRPITNASGANSDGNWSTGTILTPAVAPPAATGSTWDVLSALEGRTMVGSNTPFVAAVQGVNPVSAAAIDALYSTALDSLLQDASPSRAVNIVWCARVSATIRTALKAHVKLASSQGVGRVAVVSPELTVQSLAAVQVDTDPGVGANRDESVFYAWPGWRTFIPEAVNFRLKTADGNTTIDGILDVRADGVLASLLSVLPPERNPGQAAEPVPTAMASFTALQRGAPSLGLPEFIQMKSVGIVGSKIDRTAGPIFQSGITTSLVSGQQAIARRRMANYIEDTIAQAMQPFQKLPISNQLKDSAVGEINAFLSGLVSAGNPSAQRIDSFLIDDKSGNTPTSLALGIYVIIVKVKTTPTADYIVIQFSVGNTVDTTTGA